MSVCEMRVAGRAARLQFTDGDYLRRYPRLAAHFICETAGHFEPIHVALALRAHDERRAFMCQWYIVMAQNLDLAAMVNVGRAMLWKANRNRHFHKETMPGYYRRAAESIRRALIGGGPVHGKGVR